MEPFSFMKNAFENVVWEMAAMLSRPQWVQSIEIYKDHETEENLNDHLRFSYYKTNV